ncbi:hypothetical protein OEZ85_001752 [Tetradesmus obliquus]|uniref:Sulfatase N-terminal domain-containing protein n=1 Tax=Tetradesmus obliquus TaxID=3088 RepID=A0ABY8U0T8_TETOB|nr:hypothetical protein OEZ85_001752 [Tetradesmus obliquus]
MNRAFCASAVLLAYAVSAAAVAAAEAAAAARLDLGPGYAKGCTPPNLQSWPVQPPRVPPLSPSDKPNFVVIQVDDMGWDDIGLHHPRGPDGVTSAGAQTPNLDKLIKSGMSFSNFYVAPLCAMGRAQLLTGRDYPRTGNLFNGYGYDAINLGEATLGNVMQAAGYTTAHYGKWHNSRSLGYEPWWRGFNTSWLPSDTYLQLDNLMRHNGRYVQTKGLVEQIMADKMLGFMKQREEDKQPFMVYYAPYAIHATPTPKRFANYTAIRSNETAKASIYFQPEPYKSKILQQQPPPGQYNAGVWAFLMYLDDVLGKIFDYVDSSPVLRRNTYIMLTSDNGLSLSYVEDPAERLQRMPSGMIGDKNRFIPEFGAAATEGSLRNHLAVWGPGVPAGGVSDTLLNLADILPTIAELASAEGTTHERWSGHSFANLLQPNASATPRQTNRMQFTLVSAGKPEQCPPITQLMSKLLPTLGPDREVLKPQPLLAYTDEDGNNVMKHCIVGRYGEYKWYGRTDKVYRLANGSYIELPCNEIPDQQGRKSIAALFNTAAKEWWDSVLAEPHSFSKPVYLLGLDGAALTDTDPSNVEASGIVQLRRGSMAVDSIVNYTLVNDFGCWKIRPVQTATYQIIVMYHVQLPGLRALFQLDIIKHGARRRRTFSKLQFITDERDGAHFGSVRMEASKVDSELCLKLVDIVPVNNNDTAANGTAAGTAASGTGPAAGPDTAAARRGGSRRCSSSDGGWLFRLVAMRLVPTDIPDKRAPVRRPGSVEDDAGVEVASGTAAAAAAAAAVMSGVPVGMPADVIGPLGTSPEPARYEHFKPSDDMVEFERRVRQEAIAEARADFQVSGSSNNAAPAAAGRPGSAENMWQQLRHKYNWMEGQMTFRSLYRPCIYNGPPGCMETCG